MDFLNACTSRASSRREVLAAARDVFLAALLAAIPAPILGAEDAAGTLERRVKAAFVSKFAGYVEWPERAFADGASPIVIGVAGADSLAEEIEQAVTGRKSGEREMRVRRLAPGEPPSGLHILFVGRGVERARAAELLATSQGKPVLTVTESDRGQPQASVINFLAADERIRFDISRDAAERNGLRLGSALLAVARQVRTGAP